MEINNMKKQVIAAAVAATMSAVAIADVSITGAAQVNYTYKDTAGTGDTNTISHDFDLKITGKSGDTTIVMDIENVDTTRDFTTNTPTVVSAGTTKNIESSGVTTTANLTSVTTTGAAATLGNPELNVKNAYMKTTIGGVNVQMGTWTGGEALLANAAPSENKISLDTTIGGVKLQYENNPAAATGNSVTVSGGVEGVKVTYEKFETKDDVIVDLAYGPIKAQYRTQDDDADSNDQTSYQIDAEVQGMTVTYANIDAKDGVSSDGFFGEYKGGSTDKEIDQADGFGIKTSMGGNTVNLKSYEVTRKDATVEDHNKVVLTRALESGATLEVTYDNMDTGVASSSVDTLDIELRIAF
jgi:hypothetical protein